MSTPYKPLTDNIREKCIELLRTAIALAQENNMAVAELSVRTVITVLETRETDVHVKDTPKL